MSASLFLANLKIIIEVWACALFLSEIKTMRYFILIFFFLFCIACGNDDIDLSGDTALKIENFYQLFTPISNSKKIADTGLLHAVDTLQIKLKLLHQFVPDSITIKATGKKADAYTIYPLGYIGKEEQEKYVLIKYVKKQEASLWVYVFGSNNQYKAAMKLLSNDVKDKYSRDVLITPEPTFISNKEKITTDITYYTKVAMAYNAADNSFINVMKDSNEDDDENMVINPIDTLPKKNKYSGDYVKDKRNFICVRDGKNDSTYQFFLHIDKKNGDCTGELKSGFTINKKGITAYKEGGDPCVINFTFSSGSVVMLEEGSCGNRRGMDCLFDDTFKKQKPQKEKK